ncbi:MAG TPA: hypothetical protein VMJ10_34210 [Kofleriaceae bacterium]|nr:hypothetical protein [Kofleriaceae bacterium]
MTAEKPKRTRKKAAVAGEAAAPKPKRVRAPRAPAKTTAAVLALADDPRVSDVLVAAELGALPPARRKQVVAAWTERVAAGESGLVTRLLAMFELAALGAKTAAELYAFIEPLREVGGLPEVFPHVEHALSSEREAVREAVCARWLADSRAQRVFDDSQIDILMRCAVAIAEGGGSGGDRDAACAVLRQAVHPGARDALMDAIRHGRVEKGSTLRADLYAGLVANRGRHLVPFLIERLFDERSAYGALVDACGRVLDDAAHRAALTALAQRAREASAVHAATLYADTLARAKAKPKLVELARTVLAWQPASNDDARRLRHVLELGIAAALASGRTDDARPIYARARQLPDAPYSDYYVLARDARTPALLEEPRIRKQLATF